MPDFLQLLRLQNLFNPSVMMGNDLPSQGGFTGNMPNVDFGNAPINPMEMAPPTELPNPTNPMESQPPAPMGGSMDIAKRMLELYHPSTEASDRFNSMIDTMPKMEDYHPGKLRRIGGMLTAVGGSFDPHGNFKFNPESIKEGEKLRDEPFLKQYSDWKSGIEPAYQSANLERQENINSRTLAYQTVANELRAKADEERARNNQRNADVRQQRADVYEFKAKNPNLKLIIPKGGNIQAFNPVTGEVADTGIPSGSLTDADKLALQQENALERIGATGEQTRETEGVRHTNRMTEIGARGEESRKTRQTPSASQTGKGELPTQTRVRQFNKAREIANSNPDLAEFITFGNPGTSDFEVQPPKDSKFWGHTGPTQEQYDQIIESIYGEENAPKTPTPAPKPGGRGAGAGPGPTATPSPKTDAQGKVVVIGPDGKRYKLPASQLQQALKQGYKLEGS